ncbi:MAG: hypothetical protein HZB55_05715 [Deltaproteobacteria bacterium]|nr:hypothetical protein [Deltaproteobacteria bacterium]
MTSASTDRPVVLPLTLASAAFGFIEGAVVVYLRALAGPGEFGFPLAPLPERLVLTEIAREAATIVLLLGMSWATAREGFRRFAAFAFSFGVWDLTYYAALKALLHWPGSWLTWDVLFLIPVPWLGPVLAPLLVSAGLVSAALLLLGMSPGAPSPLRLRDWIIEAAAGLAIVGSFVRNWRVAATGGVPTDFPWWLFGAGFGLGLGWFLWRWVGRLRPGRFRP